MFEHPEVSDLRAVALHESSHAVIAQRLGLIVTKVEIENLDGYSHIADFDGARPSVRLAVLMAGAEAEREFLGAEIPKRPIENSDQSRITDVLVQIDRRQWTPALTQARQASRRMVCVHRGAIAAVASALLERCAVAGESRASLDGDALADLLGGPAVAILRAATQS